MWRGAPGQRGLGELEPATGVLFDLERQGGQAGLAGLVQQGQQMLVEEADEVVVGLGRAGHELRGNPALGGQGLLRRRRAGGRVEVGTGVFKNWRDGTHISGRPRAVCRKIIPYIF